MTLKLWLDDERQPPNDSWVHVTSGHDFKDWLKRGDKIDEISFDHDIATFDAFGGEITGYTCLCWIEKLWFTNPDYELPKLSVHTANGAKRITMQKVIDKMQGVGRLF